MLNSKAIEILTPLFSLLDKAKGKTIGELKAELRIVRGNMKKGASGLIVENLLGIKNNNNADADIPDIGCEVKILPIQKKRNGEITAKEPTQIQMINYFEVAKENWDNAKIRKKINLTLWVVYLAKEDSKSFQQDEYKIIDYFIDHPDENKIIIFKNDWESIQGLIINGLADKLTSKMGEYLEPKTKGANNLDKTNAPDGNGGTLRARRRAFYYKKKYTNKHIIPELDLKYI